MKRTVKLLSLILSICFIATAFAGCGDKDRILFKSADLTEYITLGEYKGITVDMNSKELVEAVADLAKTDIEDAGLYDELDSGKVKEGDIANIDYEGKEKGVAFEGGTAQDYDLEIGSGQFIPGFEEKLVGVKIGDTVDLNLSFPKDYHSEDLAGKAVVFTVTVNFVKRYKTPDKAFEELGFKNYAAYEKDLEERTAKQYLFDAVCANSKVKNYPKEDIEILYPALKNQFVSSIQSQYQIDFATYLQYTGMTEEEFKEEFIKEKVKPGMDGQIVVYAIIDKEDLEFDTEKKIEETEKAIKKSGNSNVTIQKIKETYGDHYFEELAATEAVLDFIYDNAKISK